MLRINVENDNDKKEADINCKVCEIKGSYYTLCCQGENDILYNLQSAVSFLGDDLLLINFDENINSKIIFSSSSSNYNTITRKSSSKGLSAGAIVAIVLAPIVVLGAIITFIILKRRASKPKVKDISQDTVTCMVLKDNKF